MRLETSVKKNIATISHQLSGKSPGKNKIISQQESPKYLYVSRYGTRYTYCGWWM